MSKPSEPEDEWPHCKICGEKCFTNPGNECSDCGEYPLCNWCAVKGNCHNEKINPDARWSGDKEFLKPVMTLEEILGVQNETSGDESE